jgi:hypothetical protein
MTITELIKKTNTTEVIDTLVSLHSLHYYEPGFILDRNKIKKIYKDIVSRLKHPGGPSSLPGCIDFVYNNKTEVYDVYVNIKDTRRLLRDWWDWSQPLVTLQHMTIITKKIPFEQALAEVLVEITFHLFPEKQNIEVDV